MKKRLLTLILTIVSILMCIFGLSACKDDGTSDTSSTIIGGDTNCEHLWSNWTEEQEATCKTMGLQSRVCTLCEAKEEKTIEKTAHKYNSENACEYCGVELAYTSGLVYEKPNYANYYVVKGIGTATETDIVIPAQHAGVPVKKIATEAFYGNDKLTSVTAPSIIEIEREAFYYCEKLHSIEFNSVETIGYGAFNNCKKLNKITLPKTHLEIVNTAFLGTEYFNNDKNWKNNALYISEHLISVKADYEEKTFTIKSGTLSVAYCAFENVSSIETIQFPENEILIGSWAFSGCDNWKEFEVRENIELIDGSLSGTSLTKLVIPVKYAMDSVSDNTANVNTGMPNTLKTLIITKSGYSYYPSDIIKFSFSGFTELEYLEHPFQHTGVNANGSWNLKNAYSGLKKLKTLKMPALPNSDYVTHISEFFSTTYFDESISFSKGYIPVTLKEITIDGGCVSEGMFSGCKNFDSITIKNLSKSESRYSNIGYNAFACLECENLIFDNSVGRIPEMWLQTEIKNLFYDGTLEEWLSIKHEFCSVENLYISNKLLENVEVPDGTIEIPSYAFAGFRGIRQVLIADSVTKIGESAFNGTNFYDNEENWENGVLYCGKFLIKSKEEDCGNNGIKDGTLLIADGAFKYSKNIPADLTIPNCLLYIGVEAFGSCHVLQNISFAENSKLKEVGASAFYSCSLLSSIDFGDNSCLESIGSASFASCELLSSVDFGHNSCLESIGSSSFAGTALISITIPSAVKNIGSGAFSGIGEMTEINFCAISCEDFDSRDDVFANAGVEGEGVIINVAKEVTRIPAYFVGTIYDSYSPKIIFVIFEEGSKLTSVGWRAFQNCNMIENIKIPQGTVNIGSEAFANCSSLTKIELPNSLEIIGSDVFSGCQSLQFTIDNNLKYIGNDDNKNLCLIGLTGNPTNLSISDNCKIIVSGAFSHCKVAVIEIPNSVINIGYEAFYECEKLIIYCEIKESEKPSGWDDFWNRSCPVIWDYKNNDIASDGYVYTTIDGLRYCIKNEKATIVSQSTNISSATIKDSITYKNKTYSVTSIDSSAFSNCTLLTNIEIPNSVTSIDSSAFSNCTSLTSIRIPSSVINIGKSVFYNCRALTIYCEATEAPTGWYKDSYGYQTWNQGCPIVWDCNNNEETANGDVYVVIDNIRYRINNGEAIVAKQLRNIAIANIPNSITYKSNVYRVTSIDSEAFCYCENLTSVILPNSIKSIGYMAFAGCSKLTSITIPNSVSMIYASAFSSCSSLTIYCEASGQPAEWAKTWNSSNCPVEWGYKG